MSNEQNQLNTLMVWMQNALLFPEKTSSPAIAELVESSTRLTGEQHLAIYQRSYYARLLKCLREQFPALCFALGKNLFTDFAREYLQKYPSESYTLHDLSRRFPNYLEETRPDRGQKEEDREEWIDFMIDLARFERQIFKMFDAPGNEGKPFADKKAPDEDLHLQPCFATGQYRFPVDWYYHEVRKANSPKYPLRERSFVAFIRRDFVTHTIRLRTPHFIFLTALGKGKSIKESLDLVAQELAIPKEKVYQSWNAPDGIKKRWINAGFFICKE